MLEEVDQQKHEKNFNLNDQSIIEEFEKTNINEESIENIFNHYQNISNKHGF